MREQSFLNHLSDHDDPPRKIDIFITQISAITERVSIGREKTPIRSNNEQTRRRLHAVVDRLSLHFIGETFEANFARLALHQPVIMQRLQVSDVAAVPIFFPHVTARRHIGRDISRTEKYSSRES